jgi:uncharacterized protein (TIGR02421 family)
MAAAGIDAQTERALALDTELAAAARSVRILEHLAWPGDTGDRFLAAWRAGRRELPEVNLAPVQHTDAIAALESIAARCDPGHPLSNLVLKTAESYAAAGRMLGAIGTPEFTRWSITLYGRPDDVYHTQDWTGLDAARFMLDTTDELCNGRVVPETTANIPAEDFAARLRRGVDEFFTDDEVEVLLDPNLSAKAIAGSRRIRLREGALYSELDLGQLLNHEALIHTGTMLNGKKQPRVQCLGLGAPRTTRTQEGLAVYAEIVTLSIDIPRLRRIALRVSALKMALDGADFIQVFEHFLEAGQSEEESYKSAQRIFRGGDVRGGTAFTKDSVYLKGLLEVHAFLRIAVRDNRPELLNAIFAGRMTLGDAVELAPLFESGLLAPATYVPPWARDLRTLASMLTFSAFSSRADLSHITLADFPRLDERLAAQG